jgi:pimeloyl-ACP methyl ester carboxylesterase
VTNTRSGEAKVDGGELHYEERGSGQAIVLLHGGVLSNRMWDEHFALLARTHRVVRYDARGHGQSSTPIGSFEHHEDLRVLLDTLGIERATLVGLSGGARISIDFMLTHPGMVNSLVLTAPGISGMQQRDPVILALLEEFAAAAQAGDLPGMVEAFLRQWVDGPLRKPEQVDPELRERCRVMAAETLGRHGGSAFVNMREVGAVDRVADLHVPILTMVGDLDSTDIHAIADRLVAEASARKVLIPGAGHMINLEQPEIFAKTLLDFLGVTPVND